jgi:uncharacterized membrane protein
MPPWLHGDITKHKAWYAERNGQSDLVLLGHGRVFIVSHGQHEMARMSRVKLVGLGFVFLWFLMGGVAHFAATELEMSIVPSYVPWPRFAVLVSGVFELLGAIGLLVRRFRGAAGFGLFLLTLAVTPANVYMLEHSEQFAVPYALLVLRLPLQVGLLALIVWSSGAARVFRRKQI